MNYNWILVMGVSGSGKSTIGAALAKQMNLPFLEADEFHGSENISKMAAGIPLDDLDREPWLSTLNQALKQKQHGAILACSALKESYRKKLKQGLPNLTIVYLDGSYEEILKRMEEREGHFMPTSLLKSQFETLEIPRECIRISVLHNTQNSVNQIINKITNIKMEQIKSDIGVLGLGVMGKSLARNFASKNYKVSVYNVPFPGEENITSEFVSQYGNVGIFGTDSLEHFVAGLQSPKIVLLMIQSGDPVDEMLQKIIPLLDSDDIIIDAGNSFYKDTMRRSQSCANQGINFVGMGVSGGEEGALKGPSIMPAGNVSAKKRLLPMLEKVAAMAENEPCVKWIGPDGAGHFVKMIHNGIEYADMQLITEAYAISKNILGLNNEEIADMFEKWMEGLHSSYLLEITIDILRKKEHNQYILDEILDVAGHKGTGMWTSREALELGVAVPSITAAMNQRIISAYKKERTDFSDHYLHSHLDVDRDLVKISLEGSFLAARFLAIAEGFHLMEIASEKYGWSLDMGDIASVWRSGCIIRSSILPIIMESYRERILGQAQKRLSHLFYSEHFFQHIEKNIEDMNNVISEVTKTHLSIPCLTASNQFVKSMTTKELAVNLIQAQRDYFGAHTYQTKSDPKTPKHTIWKA